MSRLHPQKFSDLAELGLLCVCVCVSVCVLDVCLPADEQEDLPPRPVILSGQGCAASPRCDGAT